MRIELIHANEFSDSDRTHWRQLQLANPSLDSPYFHPNFTAAVNAVRSETHIAVFRDLAGRALGYLPMERIGHDAARPIGGQLSDYQAIIGPNDIAFGAQEFLRGCKLSRFQFDHWLTSQPCFSAAFYTTDGSPYLDLSEGFPAYEKTRREMGADELKQTQRKARKVGREVGELRLVFHDESENAWQQLLAWKSEQYERTNATDIFAYPWTRQLLENMARDRDDEFGGVINTLYAGDTLLAAHYGLYADGVLHWWFPTYSQEYQKYSPGRILLLELARQSGDLGISKIDLGRGMTSYKMRAMTGITEVGDGTVDLSPLRKFATDTWRRTLERVRNSPLRAPARAPGRVYYRVREWFEFR
jgi:CelD/BcsL family acetyltransferase involved in cellulose biosynthesis